MVLNRGNEHACAILSLLGLAVSLYALHVEHNLDIDAGYRPFCDIASYVSCSKAFRSSFAKGLGVTPPVLGNDHLLTQRNPVYGCLTYTLMFMVQFIRSQWAANLSILLSVFMNILSVYLFGILVYLRTVCVVCVCIYIINALLLYFSLRKRSSTLLYNVESSAKKKS